MEKKNPVASTTVGTTAESKELLAFRAALPDQAEFAKAIFTDLAEDLRDLLATDPDLAGVTEAELAEWVAADIASTVTEIADRGWAEL